MTEKLNIAALKEALDGATPGPWSCHERGIHPHPYVCGAEEHYEFGRDRPVVFYAVGMNSEENALLASMAPAMAEALVKAWEAERLNQTYEAMPTDRGGPYGPKGTARQEWLSARAFFLECVEGGE